MDITHKNETIYSNINGQFVACVENGFIYQFNSYTGQKIQVGVTQQTFDELKTITDGYYDKLVEVGVITPPKSPEAIIEEQQKAMQDMFSLIKDLKAEVEVLKNGRNSITETTEHQPTTSTTSVEDS